MKDMILKRISIRKYQDTPLSLEKLQTIRNWIQNCTPLLPNKAYQIDLVENGVAFRKVLGGIVGSYGKIIAPHYLVLSTTLEEGAYENLGFMGEKLVLELTSMNIGTCWIGGGIKKGLFAEFLELPSHLHSIAVIAFGNPLESFRDVNHPIKRKNLSEIAKGTLTEKEVKIMELVRLAPSAVNFQPWKFNFHDGKVDVYRIKSNLFKGFMVGKLSGIDIGISLAHFEIGMGEILNLSIEPHPNDEGIYFRTIKIS